MIEDLFDKISDCLSEGLSELTSSTDIASSEILHSIKDINEDSFSSILDSDSLSETEILKYLDDFEDKESVLTQNDISFGSHPYNSYDDNTADFLKKCAQYDISLPPNIDHSHIQ